MFLVLAFRTDHPLDPAYRIPLGDGTLVVGRGPEVLVFPAGPGRRQLSLPDLGVSRNHADLHLDPNGQRMAWVTDLGSTNGLFVDGQPTVHTELRPGQLLEIGSCFFVLVEGQLMGAEPGCVAFSSTTDPVLEHSIARYANDPEPIALVGEVGAGAQPIAEDLHTRRRASGPFVVYDGGDLPAMLRAAVGGTLFVRDIEALPMSEVRDVHAAVKSPAGPRIIVGAASRRALGVLGAAGTGLAQRAIYVPPLEKRRHDIGRLLSRALVAAVRHTGRDASTMRVTRTAARQLLGHDWPGGYAELAAACDLAVAAMTGDMLEADHLPTWLRKAPVASPEAAEQAAPASQTAPLMVDVPADFLLRLASPTERASTLRALLAVFGGNVSALARWVGRSRRQMHRWITAEAIDADSYRRA
jgi:transcriptional regulator of acetoin/glycerol metabolism